MFGGEHYDGAENTVFDELYRWDPDGRRDVDGGGSDGGGGGDGAAGDAATVGGGRGGGRIGIPGNVAARPEPPPHSPGPMLPFLRLVLRMPVRVRGRARHGRSVPSLPRRMEVRP